MLKSSYLLKVEQFPTRKCSRSNLLLCKSCDCVCSCLHPYVNGSAALSTVHDWMPKTENWVVCLQWGFHPDLPNPEHTVSLSPLPETQQDKSGTDGQHSLHPPTSPFPTSFSFSQYDRFSLQSYHNKPDIQHRPQELAFICLLEGDRIWKLGASALPVRLLTQVKALRGFLRSVDDLDKLANFPVVLEPFQMTGPQGPGSIEMVTLDLQRRRYERDRKTE